MEPLRIGVLGAARISENAIGKAAAEAGHRLVVVAARDRSRAETFASDHGVERVVDSYGDVLADAEVEVVYNPLPNGLHGPWNLRAVAAGKHVLTEKPSTSDAAEAREVRDAAAAAGVQVVEAFHYLHHPVMRRVLEVLTSGELGTLQRLDVSMRMPPPDAGDPRWSFDLAGGSLMDVGCYGLNAARTIAGVLGGTVEVVAARGTGGDDDPRVDAAVDVDLTLPGGVAATVLSSMGHDDVDFSLTLTGDAGTLHAPAYVLPQQDDRVVVTTADGERTERLGTRSTYAYQLDALAALLRDGTPIGPDADDAIAQAELIDAVYTAADMPLRPRTTL
ncbi:Gfo/Idh/MocA family protein [Solicola sp. PLA-1-18]|uniref:Gfo/Idh/MocA family protein n=1 Tax=Solicola sp. PLA-1-18 TaxID=3380532 RepID=UPI003B7A7605